MRSPAKLAAAYMNYAAAFLAKADAAVGDEKKRLLQLAASWRDAAEREPNKSERQGDAI